jgi:virB10 protein
MNKNLQDGLENFDDGTMQLKNDIVVDNHKNRENGETLTGTSTIYQKQINSAQDLESNIPNLNNGIGQRINRKALIFLLLMGIVVVSIFMYAMSLFSTNDKANMEQVKEEVVDIPSSPIPSPALDETPAPVQQPTTNIDQQTELPTPPELVSVPAVPSVSSLQVPTIDSPVPSTVNESFGFKDSQDSGGISRSGGGRWLCYF